MRSCSLAVLIFPRLYRKFVNAKYLILQRSGLFPGGEITFKYHEPF